MNAAVGDKWRLTYKGLNSREDMSMSARQMVEDQVGQHEGVAVDKMQGLEDGVQVTVDLTTSADDLRMLIPYRIRIGPEILTRMNAERVGGFGLRFDPSNPFNQFAQWVEDTLGEPAREEGREAQDAVDEAGEKAEDAWEGFTDALELGAFGKTVVLGVLTAVVLWLVVSLLDTLGVT